MHYAITIKDGLITDLHRCSMPFTLDNLDADTYGGQDFVILPDPGEITAGQPVAAYNTDWTLRPLIDRINEGLAAVPEGYKLVDGQLIAEVPTPESEQQDIPSAAELMGILLGGAL